MGNKLKLKTYGNRSRSNRKKLKNSTERRIDNEHKHNNEEQEEMEVNSPQIITKRQKKKSMKAAIDERQQSEECEQDDIENEDDESEEHYEVECIVKHRKSLKKDNPKYDDAGERCYEYFVKWKGWESSTNTWEHQQNLSNCKKLIDAYWAEKDRQKKEKEQRKKDKKNKKKKKIEIVIETENKQKMDEQNKENKENQKKKYKAKRTLILSDSEDNNEEYEDVPIEMNEDVKEEEHDLIDDDIENEQCVVEEVDNQDIDSNASRKLKKRSYSEENTISDPIIESPIAKEPPLKKRKFEETK